MGGGGGVGGRLVCSRYPYGTSETASPAVSNDATTSTAVAVTQPAMMPTWQCGVPNILMRYHYYSLKLWSIIDSIMIL